MSNIARISVPAFVAATAASNGHAVLLLLGDGSLTNVDLSSGARSSVGHVTMPKLDLGAEPHYKFAPPSIALQSSASGRFVAASADFAASGANVVDLISGRQTIALECPTYLPTTVPFSVCFITQAGRELVVYRSEWNRLDARDAETGELLTSRESPTYEKGRRSAHYLDYFHGRLRPSPNGDWILDDGWVWSPLGVPYLIGAKRWLSEDIWESEDAPSRRELPLREDWNFNDCWIDDRRLAFRSVRELGEDDEFKVFDGSRIFNVEEMDIAPVAIDGARGRLISDGARLFTVADGATTAWSTDSGEKLFEIDEYEPDFAVRGAGVLVGLSPGELLVCDV